MADSLEAIGCAKKAGKNKRKHRRNCRGGGLANRGYSATTFLATFTNFSYGLSAKVFYFGLEVRTEEEAAADSFEVDHAEISIARIW
jgi:hypothetical protein